MTIACIMTNYDCYKTERMQKYFALTYFFFNGKQYILVRVDDICHLQFSLYKNSIKTCPG